MTACREGPPKRKSVGPMRRPMTEQEEQAANKIYGAAETKNKADEAEDEGEGCPCIEAPKGGTRRIKDDMCVAWIFPHKMRNWEEAWATAE